MRKRGFTIVEVSLVVFIIIMLASAIYPSLSAIQRSQADIGFRQAIESVCQRARNEAIQQNRATVVKFNNNGQIGWDFSEEQAVNDNNTTPLASTQTNNQEELALGEVRNAVAPTAGTSFVTYELNRQNVGQSDWLVGFYPDGSADRAYLEFTMDEVSYVLIVNPKSGSSRVVKGTIDEQANDEWDAGEIERRVG